MKKQITFWSLRSIQTVGLAAVLLASACAPTAPIAADTPLPAPTPTLEAASQPLSPTEAPAMLTPQAVATSRGPNLEATDPSTVKLASGGLQLVEFFRFT
ncbi:MAG: hypothetical protein MUO77_21590 [Anaerolineales bacterium]|nr:hypothetical protein [Anaerolineales bacterium]